MEELLLSSEVKVGDTLETKMKDGIVISTINEVKNNGKGIR